MELQTLIYASAAVNWLGIKVNQFPAARSWRSARAAASRDVSRNDYRMRNAILFLSLTFISIQCLSQDSADVRFLERRVRMVQPKNDVYYSEYALRDYYKDFKKYFKRKVVGIKGDTLHLSSTEENYLKRELRRRVREKFPDRLFPDFHRKPKDSIISIVEKLNMTYFDSIRNVAGKVPSLAYFQYWAFSFSRPVYLRNREWMIFFFMYYANSSGEHSLSFFKKGTIDWELFGYVCGGAW